MSGSPSLAPPLSAADAAQVASLEVGRASLVAEAQAWAVRLEELADLAVRAELAGPQIRRTLALELAGSWQVGQLTAERWIGEAERVRDALPLTLSMLHAGSLLVHQAKVLLHRTALCTPDVASAVEREVLPAGAGLCPSDLARTVERVKLRIERERADAADAQRQNAERVAERRTWLRPVEDEMAVVGALVTAEQGVAWAAGMDLLERRERLADRAAGIDRTAEQRRADIFAALPAMVLAGAATDDRWRRAAGARGGRPATAPTTASDTAPVALFVEPDCPPPWTFSPEQVAAHIVLTVHVPVATVLDLAHAPGSLDGFGPVGAEHVRLLRPRSFRRVLVDAATGRPIAVDDHPTPAADSVEARRQQVQDMLRPDVIADSDEPQHDPSARLARLIDLRDVRCAGPGCSSSRCDRDHLDPWPRGATSAANLGLLSPRCHSAKHHGWTLHRHPDGSVTWHSPLRQRYDRPGPWDLPPRVELWNDPASQPQRPDRDHDVSRRGPARAPDPTSQASPDPGGRAHEPPHQL